MRFSIANLLLLTTAFAFVAAFVRDVRAIAIAASAIGIVSVCTALACYPLAILMSPQKSTYLDIKANKFVRSLNTLMIFGCGLLVAAVMLEILARLGWIGTSRR